MNQKKIINDHDEIIDFKRAPLVPIRNVVVFPNIVQPLKTGNGAAFTVEHKLATTTTITTIHKLFKPFFINCAFFTATPPFW